MIIELTLGTTEVTDKIKEDLATDKTIEEFIKDISIQTSQKQVGFLEDLPSIITITIDLAVGISASMLANWLFQSLKNKTKKLVIHKEEIILTEDELKKTIEKIYFSEDV